MLNLIGHKVKQRNSQPKRSPLEREIIMISLRKRKTKQNKRRNKKRKNQANKKKMQEKQKKAKNKQKKQQYKQYKQNKRLLLHCKHNQQQ